MEKSKYANIALILALISLVDPILSILTNLEIVPKIAILATFLVTGTGLLGLILGILGYKDTEQKWKPITAIVVYIVGTIVYFIFGYVVMFEVLQDIMSGFIPDTY